MVRSSYPGILLLLVFLLSACLPVPPASTLVPSGSPTVSAENRPTAVTVASNPNRATMTAVRTLPTLPGPYQTALLNPLDTPHTYIQSACRYLQDKWSSANSAPGTLVMVIMFHNITNAALTNPNQISEFNFRQLMKSLHQNGFQAITTLQLDGFLEHNSKIPERSVLLGIRRRVAGHVLSAQLVFDLLEGSLQILAVGR